MSRLDAFNAEFKKITSSGGPAPDVVRKFLMRQPLFDWLGSLSNATGVKVADLLNRSIYLTANRWLAMRHGLHMVLLGRSGTASELPAPAEPFITADGPNIRRPVAVRLLAERDRLLDWMNTTLNMSDETVVHDGVRILGAVATNPKLHLCITADGKHREGIVLANSIDPTATNLPPFPAAYR